MTVTTDVENTGSTLTGRFTIKNIPTLSEVRKPVYAYVGAADLAIEQVKALPGDVTEAGRKVQALLVEVPAQVRTLTEQTGDFYTKLALRGQRLVTQIRRQPATEAAIAEGKEAVKKVEAAGVAAKKSVRAGEKAVRGAAGKIG